MLTVLVVSIIAAFAFAAEARKRGHDPLRFGIYPILVGGTVCLAALALHFIVGMLIKDEASPFLRAYPYLTGLFSFALLFIVLSKAWRQMKHSQKK